MRREERVTVQGPLKEQQPDGMSHRGGGASPWGFDVHTAHECCPCSGVRPGHGTNPSAPHVIPLTTIPAPSSKGDTVDKGPSLTFRIVFARVVN